MSKNYLMKGERVRECTSGRENNAFRISELRRSLMVLRNQKKGHIARGQRASGPRLVTLDHTGPLRCPKTQDLSLHHGRLQVSDDPIHVLNSYGIDLGNKLEWHCH